MFFILNFFNELVALPDRRMHLTFIGSESRVFESTLHSKWTDAATDAAVIMVVEDPA
jgi:hypothetical protein